MLKNVLLIFLSITLLSITSCKSDGTSNGKFEVPDSLLNVDDSNVEIEDDAKKDIVENIASPVEMAALIKSLNVPFSKEYLAPTSDVEKYASSFTKAFNLGIFGADLGYINMYNKVGSVIDYISAIKKLADGINVGQFFDFQTLKRLASNSQNIDSMMYISVHSFNKMDSYLTKNKRGNLSALMISGVWIEGLYLGTQVAQDNPSEKLKQTIGEQKNILNELLLILDIYKRDQFVADLIKELKVIKQEFDNVKITIEVGEPESIIKDGKLMIIQHEKSIVHISDEQFETIIKKTEEIRNKLISLR